MPFNKSFDRQMFKVTCADCGLETEVPFKPDGKRPVYCRDCYQKHKPQRRFDWIINYFFESFLFNVSNSLFFIFLF